MGIKDDHSQPDNLCPVYFHFLLSVSTAPGDKGTLLSSCSSSLRYAETFSSLCTSCFQMKQIPLYSSRTLNSYQPWRLCLFCLFSLCSSKEEQVSYLSRADDFHTLHLIVGKSVFRKHVSFTGDVLLLSFRFILVLRTFYIVSIIPHILLQSLFEEKVRPRRTSLGVTDR